MCMGPMQGPSRASPLHPMTTQPFFPSLGYYTQISTLADAQENVMEYLHVLSRPMVINHDHDIIWTEAYMDSRVSMMLTPGGQGGPELREEAGGDFLVQRSQYCAYMGGVLKGDGSLPYPPSPRSPRPTPSTTLCPAAPEAPSSCI